MKAKTAVLFAVLAAVLYSLLTPVSKLLMMNVPPVAEAGLLYLGAGAGMAIVYGAQRVRGRKSGRPSVSRRDLKYIAAMVILDTAAPILLLLGLSLSAPESVSLLNNFEIVATTVIAAALFRETVSRKLALSVAVMTVSCALLSLDGEAYLSFSIGSVFVLLACICWGFENNCTSSLSAKDTRQIVIIKGFGSGTASLLVSLIIKEGFVPSWSGVLVMALGFLTVGLSVYFYVLAQSRIGAARTSSYYAVSPFMGVLLSLLLFRDLPGPLFWVALALMAVGVFLNVRDTQQAEKERVASGSPSQ